MGILIRFFSGHTMLFCVLLAAVFMTLWWFKFQKKLNLKPYYPPIFAIVHMVFAVVVMKIWALVEVGFNTEAAANMRLYGVFFIEIPLFIIIGYKILKTPNIRLFTDVLTIAGMIGLAVGRVNCLMKDCCYGRLISEFGPERWPLREIEIVYSILFVLYFAPKVLKGKTNGEVAPIGYIGYGVLRFLMEFLREEYTGQVGPLHLAHIWSLISIAAGIFSYIMVKKQSGRKAVKKSNPLEGKGGKEK